MSKAQWIAMALTVVAGSAWAQEEAVNLALTDVGGIPSALSSAPNLAFSAQKAADGREDTAWVSGTDESPVWLSVEWRFPVQVQAVRFRQFRAEALPGIAPVGAWTLEAQMDGAWSALAAGDASSVAADAWVEVPLDAPMQVTALRLVMPVEAGPVAIAELQVLGPAPVLPMDFAPRWSGRFIWVQPSLVMPQRQPVRRYFRRGFTIDDPAGVREAWVAACAFDRLTGLWLNDRLLLTDVSYAGGLGRIARTARVPVEALLAGENVLAAAVDDLAEVGSRGLLAELVLVGADGTRTVIGTDEQWVGQADQGSVLQWRKPGFAAADWVPARVGSSPNGSWHWLWNTRRPILAPADSLRVTELTLQPERPVPGTEATLRIGFEAAAPVGRDYAIIVRLGQDCLFTGHDLELWGAALAPEEARTGAWAAGRHEVTVRLRIPPEAPRDAPATLLVATPEIGAGLTTDLPGCRADEYGLHFTIPVDRGPTPQPPAPGFARPGFARNEIADRGGTPTLHIDGEPVAPIIWTSAHGNYRRYAAYAATGVKLFRPVIGGSPIPAPGEAEEHYRTWFAEIDRVIEAALAVDPEIRVLPSITLDPSPQVLFDQPAEQFVTGRGQTVIKLSHEYPDRGQVRPTFMSEEWRRQGAEGLRRLVEHMAAQPYASRVVGLCFFAGRAGENYWGGNELNIFLESDGTWNARPREEWDAGDFSAAGRQVFRDFLVRKYTTDAALQAAWRRDDLRLDDILSPARLRRDEICDLLVGAGRTVEDGVMLDPTQPGVGALVSDYYQCYAEAMIDTFAAWGRAVKQASGGRLIAGCYYGYALAQMVTSLPGFHGHTAIARAAASPDLDFFVSPAQYDNNRRAGGNYWGWNIPDSLRLHNKLFIYEQDTRTYLSDIGPKSYSRRETIAVLQRDCAKGLTHGSGWWWYEFADGQRGARSREWFDDPEIADFAARIKRVYDYALRLPDRGPSAQIAIFYHGETLPAQDIFNTLALNIPLMQRTLLDGVQRIGAPYDLYNLADLPLLAQSGRLAQYRLCIFLNPFFLTAPERASLELAKAGGRTLVWFWAPGIAQVGEPLSVERVAAVTGIEGIDWRRGPAQLVCRLSGDHPILAGIAEGTELAPVAYGPGATWARFGNAISPVLFVDPARAGTDTQVLGHLVLDGQVQPQMAGMCVRARSENGGWNSVYCAVPLLTPELMRNLARFAGVHVYRDANDILYADRQFVAVHTGAAPATDELRLPAASDVYDVFGQRVVATGVTSFALDVPAYSTALYYLGDAEAFVRAVDAPER